MKSAKMRLGDISGKFKNSEKIKNNTNSNVKQTGVLTNWCDPAMV